MVRLMRCRMRRQRTLFLLLLMLGAGNFFLYVKFKASNQIKSSSKPDVSIGDDRNDIPLDIPATAVEKLIEVQPTEAVVKTEKLRPVFEKKSELPSTGENYKFKLAIVVIACNRPSVGRCLDRLLKFKPSDVEIPIVVSQDCGDAATESVIRSYGDKVQLIKQPNLGEVENVPLNLRRYMGYYKISRHFKFALSTTFNSLPDIDSLIIVEDDIDIAPDFYDYFLATRPLMETDKSIWCVSAWNDNGKIGFVEGNDLLYRTDFFPGLGWMITRTVWNELQPKWPLGFWDDWMRDPAQRKGRACIRPEISRTKTFGRVGVSMGQFFDQHLKFIQLNEVPYPFRSKDLSYLFKEEYDKEFLHVVYNAPAISLEDLRVGKIASKAVRLEYGSNPEFEMMARATGVMADFKAGVPRGAYLGIVTFMKRGVRVYLAPPKNQWQGYRG